LYYASSDKKIKDNDASKQFFLCIKDNNAAGKLKTDVG